MNDKGMHITLMETVGKGKIGTNELLALCVK